MRRVVGGPQVVVSKAVISGRGTCRLATGSIFLREAVKGSKKGVLILCRIPSTDARHTYLYIHSSAYFYFAFIQLSAFELRWSSTALNTPYTILQPRKKETKTPRRAQSRQVFYSGPFQCPSRANAHAMPDALYK